MLTPKDRLLVRDTFASLIWQRFEEYFTKQVMSLVDRNCQIQSLTHRSFKYCGEVFDFDPFVPVKLRYMQQNRLHADLRGEMDDLLAERATIVTREKIFVMSYIAQVIAAAVTVADYYSLLPESVHHVLAQLFPSNTEHPTLRDDFIADLLSRNQMAIAFLQQRVIWDLLLY